MTSKTTNKFSPEIRARAVRLVVDHEHEHASRWAAVNCASDKPPLLMSSAGRRGL
jgi:hypothetical protein